MKTFEFNLNQHMINNLFKPIRNKVQIIELLMNSIKIMLINSTIENNDTKGKMILQKNKMSRLFYFTDDKYFSIAFPFFVNEIDNEFIFSTKLIKEIDNKLTSDVISLINCKEIDADCSLDFVEPIVEYAASENELIWTFLKELIFMEDGYIRYDFDQATYDTYKEKNEEDRHPLNHYDLFYSSNCTFKIGLKNRIDTDTLINLVDTTTDCDYIR